MECKVSDLVKRAHDQVAELKASCGAVDVRDVAQLISDLATQLDVQLARSNVLAAENAGLKDEISNITFMRDDDFFGSTQRAQEVMGRLVNVNTPATDAFLAEVRAQGVERLANAWYAIANETDPGISISDSSRLKYRQRADDAADFANEIRQEAAQ
ncbi:hypothetical protein M8S56_21550 [Enterobacter hormaechei]|nr:hypothetical protein [Enterobacter hormaechei]